VKQLLLAAGLVLACAGPALADPKPWAQGIPEATQDKAIAIFEEGNQLFAQQAHAPALEKYRAALKLWDHPLIRFNIAVTLIRLERPLEAAEELELALRYDDAPFKKELYQEALNYQLLLKRQVGYVEASCDQAGANILIDGKPWFTCPGTQKQRVLAGEHAIVGELKEYLPKSQRVVVAGGATAQAKITLVPLESAVIVSYRWRRWIPYTITGSGAALSVAGLLVYLAGRSQMKDFENSFGIRCPDGCPMDLPEDEPLRAQRDSAKLKGTVGISMMVVGGAVVTTGVIMGILNRPQRSLPKFEVAPTAGGASAAASFEF
jgi:hypothetical protein